MNVMSLLRLKKDVAFIESASTVRQAIEKFKYHGYAAVPVLDEEGRYKGTVTEGDLLRALVDEGSIKKLEDHNILEIIRKDFNPSASVDIDIEDFDDEEEEEQEKVESESKTDKVEKETVNNENDKTCDKLCKVGICKTDNCKDCSDCVNDSKCCECPCQKKIKIDETIKESDKEQDKDEKQDETSEDDNSSDEAFIKLIENIMHAFPSDDINDYIKTKKEKKDSENTKQ